VCVGGGMRACACVASVHNHGHVCAIGMKLSICHAQVDGPSLLRRVPAHTLTQYQCFL
jgi:hypothetical protein